MGAGKPPWPEFTNNLAALFHVATSKRPPAPPAHLSKRCHDFLNRCMQIEADDRATAAELLQTDPFIISTSPHAQATQNFDSPEDKVGITRGAMTDSDEKRLVTPRTDALQSTKSAYENSIQTASLCYPDDDFDELSVASSLASQAQLPKGV